MAKSTCISLIGNVFFFYNDTQTIVYLTININSMKHGRQHLGSHSIMTNLPETVAIFSCFVNTKHKKVSKNSNGTPNLIAQMDSVLPGSPQGDTCIMRLTAED